MSDEVQGCACCAPPSEEDTPTDAAAAASAATGENAGAGNRDDRTSDEDWVPESCTLPTVERPVRIAEFDTLFSHALQAAWQPEPTRLRLTLDPGWEDAARHLAERESQCCSFFTFAFSRDPGKLYMDIAVPADRQPVLNAMAQQATGAKR